MEEGHELLDMSLLRCRSAVSTDNDMSAQIVPDMEDKLHNSDVAMAMKTEGLPSGSAHFTSSATMTALQLSLNSIHPESHSTHVPTPVHPVAASIAFQGSPIHVATSPVHTGPISFQGSPVHVATSPVHAGPLSFHTSALGAPDRQQLILNSDLSSAYLLTPISTSLLSGNGSTLFTSPSPPSSTSLLNVSPTHSVGATSSPISIPTSPPSHTQSLPVPRSGCHRPVGPSQSVDSYFTSHAISGGAPPSTSPSSSSTHRLRPTALISPQHSPAIGLSSLSESGRSSENISVGGATSFVVSSPVDSIVMAGTASGNSSGNHRHSYTSGDVAMSSQTQVGGTSSRAHPHGMPPYRRRNSSGDLNSTRVRRPSQGSLVQSPSASLEATSLASYAHAHTHHGRTRRRSHDHMDRNRTSRSGSREPYTLNPQ